VLVKVVINLTNAINLKVFVGKRSSMHLEMKIGVTRTIDAQKPLNPIESSILNKLKMKYYLFLDCSHFSKEEIEKL
jgi:hypothetical protein